MVKVTSQVDNVDLPIQVKDLLTKRELARQTKNFSESDQLRDQIKQLGYEVLDRVGGYDIVKLGDRDNIPATNFLILFGSGEIAPTSVDIYRSCFLQLGKRDLKIALITTPAGFQPNVEHVYGEIKDFLLASLPDFNLTVEIIFANTLEDANNPELVAQLDHTDIIFLGPGSPTYAVKNLRGSLLMNKIIEQVKNRSTLILASAATITFSTHALPVYEIYKVGEPLHWQEGLGVLKIVWQDQTIIPHFNNTEGGIDLDTSYCYIGKARATKLISQLPPSTPILGLDEHTALIINLTDGSELVRGKGTTHQVQ